LKVRALSIIKKIAADLHLESGEGCKSKLRQLAEIIQLAARVQFTPDEYYTYRFYKRCMAYSDMLSYMSNYRSVVYFHPALHDARWAVTTSNKLCFNAFYGFYGLPVTNIYGYYCENSNYEPDGFLIKSANELKSMLMAKRPETLVIKPAGGSKGRNVIILKGGEYTNGDISFYRSCGSRVFLSDIVDYARKASGSKGAPGAIFEEKLNQHQLLNRINETSINTARVVTLLNKEGKAGIYLSKLRLGRVGSDVDNASQGGMFVGIKPLTGELGQGLFYSKFNTGQYSEHPDSGVRFSGLTIPYWDQVKALCIKAAELTPFCRTVGWDVAITPQGPVLIEGNTYWAIDFQAQSGGFLQPEVRGILADYGLVFPEGKLPEFNSREFRKALKFWTKIG
jgi:hypothetical protein